MKACRRLYLAIMAAASVLATATAPAQQPAAAQTAQIEAAIVVNTDAPGPVINKDIYGQFSEHLGRGVYGGLWVGPGSKIPNTRGFRNDVVAALKALDVPVLRWPGGCFADKYDWRDGIGPRADRPRRVNTAWGDVPETNAVGTDEYMDLLGQIGADAYVAGNMGSNTPMEMARWIEYMTAPPSATLGGQRRADGHAAPYRISYFGIGNESWGCGGSMMPEQAAAETRRYSTFLAFPRGANTLRVAAGPNADDYRYTEALMRDAGSFFDALSVHYYTFADSFDHKGQAVGFPEREWARTFKNAVRMEEFVTRHSAIMDRYDPGKRVMLAIDEWGTWHDTPPGADPNLYMFQNTMRDALVAALTFNIFHRHSGRVRMATIAQMINVDQAMILTDGPRMLRTPTYWAFDLYKPFKGAAPLATSLSGPNYRFGDDTLPAIDASVARAPDGRIWVALTNIDAHQSHRVRMTFSGFAPLGATGRILTAPAMDTHNTFDEPDRLRPAPFRADAEGGKLVVDMPARSIVVAAVDR